MVELPRGTVTFVFTDLVVSTRLWEQERDAMSVALARHDTILRDAVGAHDGHVVKGRGDGVHAVFATADGAVRAAIDVQRALGTAEWPVSEPLRVRVGIHTGAAELRDDDYFGSTVNRAARLEGIAHGGQIVCSHVTEELVRDDLDDGVDLVDLGEHRLRDLSRAERVFQVRAPGLVDEFPPLRSLDAYPGNLPMQVTSLVGRDRDQQRVIDALNDARVVSLIGVGGVGKTRLALQVAADVVSRFQFGAWLCELAAVRTGETVADALAAVFDVTPRGGRTVEQAIVDFLGDKELLIVLDNCEHVLDEAADLVEAIERSCGQVRVLATSREGLGIDGERILAVRSLPAPPSGASVEEIAGSDAVALFAERARALKDDFTITPENADAVAQVCRRLDGMPLAIELAAARVPTINPAELADLLDRRFQVLAGGRRGKVERHQTLRAVVDWSYDLLSPAEQRLLDRVTVFSGGWTLAASEAVCDGDPVARSDVFGLTERLVARSLVIAEDHGFQTRYRLLETIRQYGEERLAERGETNELRRRHAEHFLRFGEDAIRNAAGPDGAEWEHRLARELDNLRAALSSALDTGDVDIAVRLLAMWDAPLLLAYFIPATTVYWAADDVLALPGAAAHPNYPSVLVVGAEGAYAQSDLELALQRCTSALEAQARLGAQPSIGLPLVHAWVELALGRSDHTQELAEQAVTLARSRGETTWLLMALARSAMGHALVDDGPRAVAAAEEALALHQRLADTRTVESALISAVWALRDSEPQRALALVREHVSLGAPGASQAAPVNLGMHLWATLAGDIAAYNDERREALTYFDRAIDAAYWLGHQPELGGTCQLVAALLADDDPEAAAVLFGAGVAMAANWTHTRHRIEARDRAVANLVASLGRDHYDTLHRQGTVMSDAEIARYAHAAIKRSLGENRAEAVTQDPAPR